MLSPITREEKRRKRDKFDVIEAVHTSEYSSLSRPESRKTGKPIEPAHSFAVNLESDNFTTEKFDLFLRYQTKIHGEDESHWSHASFKRFLCSGLARKTVRVNDKTQRLGSYHHCYRLNGELIAVGVLDLLPHAVSSVYLFYDPKFEQYEFGKMSAMREIALATEGQYRYYYMGFYIHTCIKMRYKATFVPTYMLDPESLQWTLFDDDHRKHLDSNSYYSVSRMLDDQSKSRSPAAASTLRNILTEAKKDSSNGAATTIASSPGSADQIPAMEVDVDESSESDTEIPEGSLFDKHMPGVLTREEVESLDLDHWKLRVRNTFIDLEVRMCYTASCGDC